MKSSGIWPVAGGGNAKAPDSSETNDSLNCHMPCREQVPDVRAGVRSTIANSCCRAMLHFRDRGVHPGPILPVRTGGAPALSWFPFAKSYDSALVAMIDDLLLAQHAAHDMTDAAQLMRRVVDSDALHVRNRVAKLPPDWAHSNDHERIIVIDERATSHVDRCARREHRIEQFQAMLDEAAAVHPTADIWLLQSADTGTGKWLSNHARLPLRTHHLAVAYSFRDALSKASAVYTLGASEGMAGLFADKPVHVFGTPYYAGWGITIDRAPQPARQARPTVVALFEAIFLNAARYLDPETNQPGTLESVLMCIELQHAVAWRFAEFTHNAGVAFQWWKRHFATPYLTAGGGTLRWVDRATDIHVNETAAIWGGRSSDGLPNGARHFRIEDGFLHSNGLGSDMSPPSSQVIDRLGIYFDATRPNELTCILNAASFSNEDLSRASKLRESIVQFGLTKYNLGRRAPNWKVPAGKRVVLVPGQVADDASIRLGTGNISTADALLAEVRARRPDAFIVYKPHPDVMSGNRRGLVHAQHHADFVDTEADLISLIDAADEVHTLSSLSGFEALLREKEVHTYGLPFYAGWGLTHDALPQSWRERTLTIDMLVAAALIHYPVYWDWKLRLFTTPEAVVRQLAPFASRPLENVRGNRWRGLIKALRWSRNVILHLAWRYQQSTPPDTHR